MTISLESPCHDGSGTMWLRGNLHTHTTRSDGGLDPQATIRRYAGQGYDFLALSDHDTLADYTRLDPCGMILIPANEISHPGGHLLDINAKIGIPRTPTTRPASIASTGKAALRSSATPTGWNVSIITRSSNSWT